MNKRILGGLLCAAMLCAAPALAMPGMGEGKAPVDKFTMMDADKNGSVSKEEFKKFFPRCRTGPLPPSTRTRTAPSAMRNGRGFSKSHAMGRAGHPDAQMPPAGEAAPKTMPLVTPPSSNRQGSVLAGRSPSMAPRCRPFDLSSLHVASPRPPKENHALLPQAPAPTRACRYRHQHRRRRAPSFPSASGHRHAACRPFPLPARGTQRIFFPGRPSPP